MTKITIEICQQLAKLKNGLCLSSEYINSKIKLEWQCEVGHIWSSLYKNIQQGYWCRKCSKNKQKLGIEDCQKLAELKKGKCLSVKYINEKNKLEWQCEFGHIWKTAYNNIQKGHWCLKCSGKQKHTIEDCQRIAYFRDGKCLSVEYKNCKSKLLWECKFGHLWTANYNSIQQGNWCSDCNIPISELICKYMIEQIFKKPFIKVKPDFLKNPKSKLNLEIDLYNKELNIGFEHNGRHHYKNNTYSKTKNDLQKVKENDQLKLKLCKLNNTKLIIISELFKQTKIENLQEFIIIECKKLNITLPDKIPQIEIDINEIIKIWYNMK